MKHITRIVVIALVALALMFSVDSFVSSLRTAPAIQRDHPKPKHKCSHTPKGDQVQCKCRKDCDADGTPTEDRACKSYCHKDSCLCPDPCSE